jgi:hypothetical protein
MSSKYSYQLPEHPVDYGVVLAVDDLLVDPQAQRSLNEKRAQGYADNLVREALGSLIVSKRADGTVYIVDGMHRRRVCQLVGIEKIACEVHHGLDRQQEAVLFLIKNRESAKPDAFDEYKVGLTAGLPLFVDTEAVLRERGLAMGTGTSTNTVGAVAGVLRITETFGHEVLARTLDVAEAAWGRTSSTWDGMLLGGLAMFLGKHGEIVNDDQLAKKLGREGLAQLWIARVITMASAGGTRQTGTGSRLSTAYALVLNAWNKGRRHKIAIE